MAEFTDDDLKLPTFADDVDKAGITSNYLIKKLKRELNAKETKVLKIKGAVRQEDLPKGFKIITTSGTLAYDEESNNVFGDGETLIRYDPADMGIRQRARMDTNKLKNYYPAEKVDHTGRLRAVLDLSPELKEFVDDIVKKTSP